MYRNLDNSIAVTCFNHNWSYKHSIKVILDFLESLGKLPTTLLFTSRTDSKVNDVEKHKQADMHQLGQKTDMNF